MRIGLCGWTINVARYFELFDTLEVQQTFYEPPSRITMDRWREQAPAGFVFTIKAWQVITHRSTSNTYRRLRSEIDRDEAGAFRVNKTVMAAWEKTRECARLLKAKAILFQCPASFKPTDENLSNMRQFFGEIGRMRDVAYLWEPRGAWPDDVLLDICRELRLVHTVDPFLRDSVTPEFTYWRLHGIGTHYRPYTDEELQSLAARAPHENTWVMFNNIPRVSDATRFKALLRT